MAELVTVPLLNIDIFIIKFKTMKLSQFKSLIREEVKRVLIEDYTYEGIEDAILGGVADWAGISKETLWNGMGPKVGKALDVLVKELKPVLDSKFTK
jgi:hypothetical protein